MTNLQFPIVVKVKDTDQIIVREFFLDLLINEIKGLCPMERFPKKKRGMNTREFKKIIRKTELNFERHLRNTLLDYFEAMHIQVKSDDGFIIKLK